MKRKKYKAIFLDGGVSCVLKNIRDMDNNEILKVYDFNPFPESIKKLNLKRGDEIVFEAQGEKAEIFGLKYPSNVILV